MITWHHNPIEYYVDRLQTENYFALAGFSDAEWYSMLGQNIGTTTGLGQLLHIKTGKRLTAILKGRARTSNFLFAVPYCLWCERFYVKNFFPEQINAHLTQKRIGPITFYERDMVTDTLAEYAGLYPFISQLQNMQGFIIGNEALADINFLPTFKHIPIPSPNFHLQMEDLNNLTRDLIQQQTPGVYLVSAGMSAALIIDALYDRIPNSFFIDCGSIWDAFVGIGSQREWRRKLYADPNALANWRYKNLHGESL